jgi:hypothetical protein
MERLLVGCSILVVENQHVVAADIQAAFESAGAHVRVSGTRKTTLSIIRKNDVSAAVLGRDNPQLCGRLRDWRIPFVVYGGFPNKHDAGAHASQIPTPAHFLVRTVVGLLRLRPILH